MSLVRLIWALYRYAAVQLQRGSGHRKSAAPFAVLVMSHIEIPPPTTGVPVSTEVAQGSILESHRYDRLLDLVPEGCLIGYLTRRRNWYHAGPGELRRQWTREATDVPGPRSSAGAAPDCNGDGGELLGSWPHTREMRPGRPDPSARSVGDGNGLRVDGQPAKRVKCFLNPEGL